jgi:hypothetical protein
MLRRAGVKRSGLKERREGRLLGALQAQLEKDRGPCS